MEQEPSDVVTESFSSAQSVTIQMKDDTGAHIRNPKTKIIQLLIQVLILLVKLYRSHLRIHFLRLQASLIFR